MKVNWKEFPSFRFPELNFSDWSLWGAGSWFVQVTVVPGLTVNVAGPNAKFWIVTVFTSAFGGDSCWVCVQPLNRIAAIIRVRNFMSVPVADQYIAFLHENAFKQC